MCEELLCIIVDLQIFFVNFHSFSSRKASFGVLLNFVLQSLVLDNKLSLSFSLFLEVLVFIPFVIKIIAAEKMIKLLFQV